MEIKDTNKLCDITWHVDLCNGTLRKDTFLFLCPLNQVLGGNSNNLINSLLLFFLKSVWLCNGGCHIWCKHKEIKTYRCYFLCSVVLRYIFFYFCCLNERNIVVLFHHQRPLDYSPPCLKQVDAAKLCCCFFLPFCYSALVCACPFSTYPLADWRVISRYCGPHRNVGRRRGCQSGAVGSVYRSKDAALCCRDHGCNIKTVGLIHDGAPASTV